MNKIGHHTRSQSSKAITVQELFNGEVSTNHYRSVVDTTFTTKRNHMRQKAG